MSSEILFYVLLIIVAFLYASVGHGGASGGQQEINVEQRSRQVGQAHGLAADLVGQGPRLAPRSVGHARLGTCC